MVSRFGWGLGRWYFTDRGTDRSRASVSRVVRRSAEALGPTFIKLAQIISAGDGLFPKELVAECKKCRDQVPPFDYRTVVATITSEFNKPLHELFSYLDPTPIAAASIAQVHRARLLDGTAVVVKVQRPGIEDLVTKDLKVLAWLAPKLVGRIPVSALANPPALVELFAETILPELDFRLEADNMMDVAAVFSDLGRSGFVVPRPHPTLVTKRVLVMEELQGYHFDDVAGMAEAGVDTEEVLRAAIVGFLEGVFLHGVFHGDLHAGNLFVLADGRIGLVDFGITGRLTDRERLAFLRLLMSGTTNDVVGQVGALCELGALPADTNVAEIVTELDLDRPPLDPTKVSPDELIAEVQRVVKALMSYGAKLPKPLMLYIKNMIFIDGAVATLAPGIDLFAEMTTIATHFATTHGARIAAELGVPADEWDLDLESMRASFGVDPSVESLTYAELVERRELIQRRLAGRRLI